MRATEEVKVDKTFADPAVSCGYPSRGFGKLRHDWQQALDARNRHQCGEGSSPTSGVGIQANLRGTTT
jgi:hypothetical protein